MKKYVHYLLRYKFVVLVCIVTLTTFFGYFAKDMRTDNSIEIWLSKNDEDYEYYKSFLKKFGDEEFLVVAFSTVNIFTKEHIKEINIITNKLKSLDGIVDVASLSDVFRNKITSPILKKKIISQHERSVMNIFKREILTDDAYKNMIVSENGKTTAIIARVKSKGPEARKKLVAEVRNELQEIQEKRFDNKRKKRRYHLAGPSVVNAELDRMSKRDMTRFTPLMFIMSIIVLACLFRNVSGVMIPVITVGVCMVWITGVFVLLGYTMNMISNMLMPLTFIISLSTSIRLINFYYYETSCLSTIQKNSNTITTTQVGIEKSTFDVSVNKKDALYNALCNVSVPILMASVTTAIGFASLATSSIPPVFTTGLFMGGCAMLAFVKSITLVPILLSFVPLKNSESGSRLLVNNNKTRAFVPWLEWLGRFTVKKKAIIVFCGFGVGIISIIGITQLRVESDIISSFPKESKILKDNNYIENHLMGLLPVEIVTESKNNRSIFEPYKLKNIMSLQNYLGGIPEITGTLSVVDYIQKTNQIINNGKKEYYTIPETEEKSADLIKLASVYGNKYVDSLYSKKGTDARISIQMKQVGSNRYTAIIDSIKDYIHKHLDSFVQSWHITGIVPLLIRVQENILRSEIQSFSLAFILTFISTAFVLKSVKIGLVSIIPNLIPITITLGLMGFTGMKLDAATIMIASIALGIAVDNTIHIFYRFKQELLVDGDYSNAVCRTLQRVGKTAVFTSLSSAFGFMVFSFSSFKPVQYFGILTSATMMSAIISDLFISPSCLIFFKPGLKKRA